MNLLYGKLIEITSEDGVRFGKVLVGGARKKVPLELLTDAACGDNLLICDGVAISKVMQSEEENHVPGDTRKTS
ncbi:MAG TPA: HypC/HybG/HupF family hydrogenase formation chaperone [Chthoniobacterales bacterium]|jgi:hydrogenase maturation factor